MDLVQSGLVFEMLGDSSQAETSLPGDIYEQTLARKRSAKFQDIKILSYWFFGLHGYAFATLFGGVVVGLPGDLGAALGLTALAAWCVSLLVALGQGIIALMNISVLNWWMVALGVLPWMIVSTEAFLVICALVAFS